MECGPRLPARQIIARRRQDGAITWSVISQRASFLRWGGDWRRDETDRRAGLFDVLHDV